MNSFYIPALAGQVYAMPGMETKLHGVFNRTGQFEGFSANYSGAGFSNMRFAVRSLPARDFERWANAAKAAGGKLDRATYLRLERPSEKEPVRRFAAVDADLFDAVVNLCVEHGKMCMHDMMAIDGKGGMGLAGVHGARGLTYDKYAARGTALFGTDRYVAATCTAPTVAIVGQSALPADLAPLIGAGLSRPSGRRAPDASAVLDRPLS
jgi:cytochrome o ubiquinol oxidase subunit 2